MILNYDFGDDDRCCCCGAYVPEGRQVCYKCERDAENIAMRKAHKGMRIDLLESDEVTDDGQN